MTTTRTPGTIFDRADLYERIYRGRGKDYAGEAAAVAALVRAARPGAAALLDAACGPGSHLAHFAREFPHVEGLDLSGSMVAFTRDRLPGVPVHLGDLRDFDLGRRFDAITCLFCSISEVGDRAGVAAALRTFARHLEPGGVLVVEPWWSPETFLPGRVAATTVEVDGRTISRMSHAVDQGDGTSRSSVHYVVGEPGTGVSHFADEHVLPLIPRDDYERAMVEAGFDVTRHDLGNGGNGAFVGVLARPGAGGAR